MNSKRLWKLVIVVVVTLVFGGSTEEVPVAQQAGRQVAKATANPEVLIVWFNPAGKVMAVSDGNGNPRTPKAEPNQPNKDRLLNTVYLVKGSHCIWDSGQLWCS